MRTLTGKPELIYKVGFIREKGKASATHCREAKSP
jgi:hypothetical protein